MSSAPAASHSNMLLPFPVKQTSEMEGTELRLTNDSFMYGIEFPSDPGSVELIANGVDRIEFERYQTDDFYPYNGAVLYRPKLVDANVTAKTQFVSEVLNSNPTKLLDTARLDTMLLRTEHPVNGTITQHGWNVYQVVNQVIWPMFSVHK